MTLIIGSTELEDRPPDFAVEASQVVDWDTIVNAEMAGNFGRTLDWAGPIQRGISSPEVIKGGEFVDLLAGNPALWQPDQAVPWTDEAEELVQRELPGGDEGQRWLIGVMRSLRDGKREERPLHLAAGFLVLSQLLPVTVKRWLPGVNLAYTCNEGCKLGGIVAAAARTARERLGIATV